jgi:hypothetical protein
MSTKWMLALGTGVIFAAAAGTMAASTMAAGATLDIKTGLWEVTSTGETTGVPPIPPEVLARMTPEQRAQMQAAMGLASKPDVSRSCITEKTLQRGLDFGERERPNCRRTMLNSTSRQIDVRMECTGRETMNGTFHFEAVDRQTMSGGINMAVTNGANTMTMKRTMHGKWLGSDCGSVKPMEE